MDMAANPQVIRQHLIDPEICIRCNTCEATCPVGAITHDSRNYVVDAGKCNLCMDCIPPCPTGSIDNWRQMPRLKAYGVEEHPSMSLPRRNSIPRPPKGKPWPSALADSSRCFILSA